MIYSLRGSLAVSQPGFVVVECAGVGYRCSVSLTTLSQLPPCGSPVFLFTHMSVKEDAVDLYGFADKEELSCFRLLVSVNGVGARVALSVLSDFTPDRLALAVAAGDAKSLTKSAGVGAKLANRIVLELKDRLGAAGGAAAQDLREVSRTAEGRGPVAEAVGALCALGYSQSEAALMLRGCDQSATVEDLIKFALKQKAERA
jgi:Holliday junction DNA helicase RuvA